MGAALLHFYRQKILFLPRGGYNFVDVRDVAAAICEAIPKGKNKEVYLLSGQYHDFNTLASLIETVSRKKKLKITVPTGLLKIGLPFAWFYGKLTHTEPSLTHEAIVAIREGHPNMNHSKARLVLNHHSRPMLETLRDFYLWTKESKS
jgi:dihydroflavonol-4-reductase